MAVPDMSKRECQGIIAAQRCYIRKLSPKTKEPFTSEGMWMRFVDLLSSVTDEVRFLFVRRYLISIKLNIYPI
jgi:hypothetical protein